MVTSADSGVRWGAETTFRRTKQECKSSNLFRPSQSIGVVCNHLPFSLSKVGDADFAVVSVGRSFHVVNIDHLRVCFKSLALNSEIECFFADEEVVFVALGCVISAYHRSKQIYIYEGHQRPPRCMSDLNKKFFISWNNKEVFLWHKNQSLVASVDFDDTDANIVAVCNLPKTNNSNDDCFWRLVIAFDSGEIQLWSVTRPEKKCVLLSSYHKTRGHISSLVSAESGINAAAVGYENGTIRILDFDSDTITSLEKCFLRNSFHSGDDSRVDFATSLDFRDEAETLVIGTAHGSVGQYDLRKRQFLSFYETAHTGSVTCVKSLIGQSTVLSSGQDNALVMTIFEGKDQTPRELRSRRGHPGPIRRMRFYDSKGLHLVTSSSCSRNSEGFLGRTSFFVQQRDHLFSSKNFGKHLKKVWHESGKLPPMIDSDHCSARHFDWSNIISCHEGNSSALVWSYKRGCLENECLTPPYVRGRKRGNATAVAISTCGNYAIVGHSNGELHRYNLQSKIHWSEFQRTGTNGDPVTAHDGMVNGLVMLRSPFVLSCAKSSEDWDLRIWNMESVNLHSSLCLRTAIDNDPGLSGVPKSSSLILLRSIGILVAVATSTHDVYVCDVAVDVGRIATTKVASVVRVFHVKQKIRDLVFSANAQWLVVATELNQIMVYDLLTASMIDWIQFGLPILSLEFHPNNAFLLTSHDHAKGLINVWANKYMFESSLVTIHTSAPSKPIQIDETNFDEPIENDEAEEQIDDDFQDCDILSINPYETEINEKVFVNESLEPGRLTLSGVAEGVLNAILHWEEIKQHNKPIDPPKPSSVAPFFIPTMFEGTEPKFVAVETNELDDNNKEKIGIIRNGNYLSILESFLKAEDDKATLTYLKKQSPAALHLAISDIAMVLIPEDDSDSDITASQSHLWIRKMFEFLLRMTKSHIDADFVQTILQILLIDHADIIIQLGTTAEKYDDSSTVSPKSSLKSIIEELEQKVRGDWQCMDARLNQLTCWLKFMTHIQME